MDFIFLIFISFAASWLTFFCGFGLGTILVPVFYLFLKDLPLAIAATTVVHFFNNIFKFLLMKKDIDWKIALPFSIAAIPAALIGAYLVGEIENITLYQYVIWNSLKSISVLNLVFGLILIGFALIELIPAWSLAFSKKSLFFGGFISGFFGGLSGHQGALRTAFLIRYNLSKEVFISTGIFIALLIDVSRASVYVFHIDFQALSDRWFIILCSLLAAIIGAITGKIYLKKIKLSSLNKIVGFAMLFFGLTLALGLLT